MLLSNIICFGKKNTYRVSVSSSYEKNLIFFPLSFLFLFIIIQQEENRRGNKGCGYVILKNGKKISWEKFDKKNELSLDDSHSHLLLLCSISFILLFISSIPFASLSFFFLLVDKRLFITSKLVWLIYADVIRII